MQLPDGIERMTSDLTETNESVRIESKKKVSLSKKRIQEREKLSGLSQEIKKLNKAKDEAMRQLDLKEQELHFLRLHQHTNDEKWKTIVACKEVEIKGLKEQLAKVKSELKVAKEDSERLHMQLQQTTVELAKQSEQTRGLEQTLAGLERERRQIDRRLITEISRIEVNYLYSRCA